MVNPRVLSVTMFFVLASLFSGTAGAGITVHTDLNSWHASLGGYETETFDDALLNPGVSVSTVSGSFLGDMWHDALNSQATTTWTFSSPIEAWGADFWDLAGPGGPGPGIQIFLDGVAVSAEIPPSMSSGFWGVTSTERFTDVLMTMGTQVGWQETYDMDNMSYSTVPVPGAFVLGLLGVGITARFRKRRLV